MQRNQLIQKELSMILSRTLSSDDKVRPGEEMSAHYINIRVYFFKRLLESLYHVDGILGGWVEHRPLNINIARPGC